MNKEAYKQQPISEKLAFKNIHFDDDKELANFYISIFQKCVENISNQQLSFLEEFPQLNQIQVDRCYVMKLQSNDLIRIARKVQFLSVGKKYFNAGNFKYVVGNLTFQQKNLQCRIVKVNDQRNLSDDYENLRDFKFVHFYQIDDKKNPKQSIKSTIKYYYNKSQQQESEEVQDRPTSQKSSINKSQVQELHESVIQEKKLENQINTNLKKENSSNLIDEDSESEDSNEAAITNNQNQITINNKNANDIQSNYQLQQQHGLTNPNQKEDQSAIIQNLLYLIKQKDMQLLDQQQIILQHQMQQLNMQRQRLLSLDDINNYNPLQIGINSDHYKNNPNANSLNKLDNKFQNKQIKVQDDDQTEIIELEDD
ncbi:hypothetical protein TTHERM_00913350 (macronuclear) [Tetrahymena thermophila SB210]|uniref:Uncharacterized protein n=1 Tax=Tetrahymena thermophila (strain SB210) TaxID=312017 RepID=Q23TT9_TETTS|nr:hypothetical protein TTHERM_00913350 [Tetrahymena thermophila SB210]EAR99956.3 hypothetical protein TTHERM_00913350 [Tetrahymena thermophila SB210]|eukprot:XP_001020201.3 hypothetical protein TTHERM_00913350 [Tetrahymena thermophila SB210]